MICYAVLRFLVFFRGSSPLRVCRDVGRDDRRSRPAAWRSTTMPGRPVLTTTMPTVYREFQSRCLLMKKLRRISNAAQHAISTTCMHGRRIEHFTPLLRRSPRAARRYAGWYWARRDGSGAMSWSGACRWQRLSRASRALGTGCWGR